MDIRDDIMGAESSGNRNAKSPTSSALGPGQFIEGTWLDLIKRYRPDLAQDKSRAEILAMRTDPELSKEMTGRYVAEHSAGLRRAGFPVTPGTIYLTHFAGLGGGIKLLKADPNMPVESVLDAKAIAANPFLKGKTVGDVIAWADRKIATAAPPKSSAGSPPAPQQKLDVPPAGDARRPQPWSPQRGAPIPYLAQTQGVGPMPGAGGTSPSVQNPDQAVAAQRALGGSAVSVSPNAPNPDARYLVRVPSPANNAPGGSTPTLPATAAPSIAPPSFDDRFGIWPSARQASAPARPTATPPDVRPSSDGGDTGFGIYKYPTRNQLVFDPGALGALPKVAAPSDAGYPVRLPSPQTGAPARFDQPGPPQQPSRRPEEDRTIAFPVPPMVYGLPDTPMRLATIWTIGLTAGSSH
ncbi:hypothetical protein [Bradyrhizobium sp. Tv2a-2]|uniref:lytic transglycosylase domain-containing protein n=1 Tax=Bradyrhizobium sp. Tv2a-2 TaxID=113395 RepID=UPI000408AE5D|nr:hypothetical protein [Bradyrhizobium sp. Tv2a-2]